MGKGPTEKIFDYIATLEKTNDELLRTLKQCVKLLAEFKPAVPDPQGWQDMLNEFHKVIKVGERIIIQKTLH